ncbi:amphiregulin [Hippocampus zosterae]|uniref:amphiregulin n=1 Tax=Hippocampus zosterae TaxID=109293 RepID=UPI00223CA69E|nr:amphiregulin [Hippocampus zosterae]
MNTFILACHLCLVLFSVLAAQGSEASSSGELGSVTVGLASGEGLRVLQGDVEGDVDFEELASEFLRDDRKKKKGKGKKKNKQKSKSTTAFNPEHHFSTQGHTSAVEPTEDPCTSTHLDYCIHGYCQRMEGLQEPVCICMKDYHGERCGIQVLGKTGPQSERTVDIEWVQMALVITAIILSIISCTAVILMACAHYRSHKNVLASYLGSWSEQQKLQKPISDVVV